MKKVIHTSYLLISIIFIVIVFSIYFSEENRIKTSKFRAGYQASVNLNSESLPLLENDTKDIIKYLNNSTISQKKKKSYKFWELLKINND